MRLIIKYRILSIVVLAFASIVSSALAVPPGQAGSALTLEQQARWRQTLAAYDYVGIARAYADFMIDHGRDAYGSRQTPLFITGLDRHTGKKINPPFPHVKRKPFMPGWERDRELRSSDRNYGQADPLDQLILLQLLHRLTDLTGDQRYAAEADNTAAWWMTNTRTAIGLYPWGTHTLWNVDQEKGGIHPHTAAMFEFNHVWPYWRLNPDALQTYARALWDHYIFDKNSGDFNRHADSMRHKPDRGMEFPWPGSAMIATWTEAYLANPGPEYVRAIRTVLRRWESLRDENGHLAPCSNYPQWAWYLSGGGGYAGAANRLDDWADRLEAKEPELAAEMRDYGRKCDAAFLKLADNLLDVKRVGIVGTYLRETGGYDPDRLDIIGGPWQDRKDYAGAALALHGRIKRSDSEALRKRYRQAVLDTAEIYMSLNPEVQWAVWGTNMANAIRLLLAAHELTGNSAYLHRADQFGRLAVDLLVDEASPLPKITSQDDFYEIERVDGETSDAWMLAILELHERLVESGATAVAPAAIPAGADLGGFVAAPFVGATVEDWRESMTTALAGKRGGVWDCTGLRESTSSLTLSYGAGGEKSLFLSSPADMHARGFPWWRKGLPIDSLELIFSDVITCLPTLDEVKPLNGPYRRQFSGKHREPSSAVYGDFKEVLDRAGLLLANHWRRSVSVTVTATLHDTWDDRETVDYTCTIEPGGRVAVVCTAPVNRFIRRLDFSAGLPGAVRLEQLAFEMVSRRNLASKSKLSTGAGPAPKLITDGLVLHLSGDSLDALAAGSAVDAWQNRAGVKLAAVAAGEQRPAVARENGRTVLRFDGRDDVLAVAADERLDLQAWTLFAVVRAEQGPGVILGKTDGRNFMMNYRLQIDAAGRIGAVVRGASAEQQVNRETSGNALKRFAVISARFDPTAEGVEKITIAVDGVPASYSYQNAAGELPAYTHDAPLLIGSQPGAEPRYFRGDMADILLYSRSLGDAEQNQVARWLSGQKNEDRAAATPAKTVDVPGAQAAEALVFLIAGQSNAGGVAAFSPETNRKSGIAEQHPTLPGSTAEEVGIPTNKEAYPRSYIWTTSFERLTPGKNLKGGYRDPWRHGIELPMAMLLEQRYPDADKFFIKHGPAGHNLHTQWAAGSGPDYRAFMKQFRDAMADLQTRYRSIKVLGLYWDQGESDEKHADAYEHNLRALFAALRHDTGLPHLEVFVRKHLFQHGNQEFAPIIAAQVKVTEEDANAHLLDLDLGSNEENFAAWAWTDNNGHLSSKAFLSLSRKILPENAE